MSTIQVDRIIPYQSSSVTIEGDVTVLGAATTGSNTFTGDQNIQGTITASIAEGFALVGGVGNISTLVATSSFGGALPEGVVSGSQQITEFGFATTGSNTFNGNQLINGSSGQTFNAPTNGNQSNIITLNGVNVGGTPFDNASFNVQDYGGGYEDVFIVEQWDSFGYNFGSEFLLNGKKISFSIIASGSATNRLGGYSIQDIGEKVVTNMFGQRIRIGAGTITDENIIIGHAALPYLSVTSLSNEFTGSVSLSSTLQLAGQDPLPAGGVGQLAVSASNLFYHNGSSWAQIN